MNGNSEWSDSWSDNLKDAIERFTKAIQEAYNQKWTDRDDRYIRKRIPYLENAIYSRMFQKIIQEALTNGN